jgi:hypothetical protein
MGKSFSLPEKARLRFEATATNALNHTNLGMPNMKLQAAAFGAITSTQGAEQQGSRVLQMALRLTF